MSQNRGTFQYGITFDTSSAKKSLQELEALMSKMDKMSVSDFMKVSGETNFHKAAGELQDLQTELKKIRTAYKDAFDPKLGVVNMQTFLQKTRSNIQDLSQKFNKMGAAGSKAFASMHANSVKISSAFRETNTLLDKMGKSLMNTIKWNISSSLVNTFTGKVQEAYGYVKHLDSSLNDIRIVTGKSADEMSRFAKEANQAAQQLGKTTTDYTEASLIYYQQGLSDSDVKNMTDLTLKASNVTGEATAQVSEYFTALKNGYQIATEDMESQVDKMAAVAATTASDLGELSTAVSRVASTAAASGVGLDSLIAQISTIESVTRQAPESIGTALKTVYARLGDLKVDGSIIDEDGFEVKLGEVSGQLQQMGVNILDVNGNMRDQQEVIEEIGAKWQNWTKEQKEAAAIAMAGKRQYNNLFALFENFDQYNKAMETSAGALGTLQKQQEIYEESTEYHLNKLTTQWEDFYDSMLDTHTINTVTDLFTGLLKGITTITDALGGGVNVLTTFVGLMGQLQSKNIVNTFIKPIIDQKFAQQFNEGNIAQVKANIQTWEKEGKTSNIAVQGQQRFAQKMDEHIGNFTKEDANAYNASIDRIGQAGAKVFEVEESIKNTKNEIDTLEKSFSKVFQESLPKGVQLTKQEAEQLNKEIKNLIDNNDIKEAEDYKKTLEDIFDKQMQAKVDALKQRLDELNKVEEELNNAATNNEKKRIRSSSAKKLNIPHKKGGLYDTERQQERERIAAQLNALKEEKAGDYNSNRGDFGDESLVKITDLIDKTQNLAQANEILSNAKKGVVQVTKEELAQAEQIVAQKRAQHYVEVAGAVATLASSLNSLINVGNTVKGMLDGSIPPLQGVLTIVTTLGMTIPMLITSLTKLVTTEVGANAVVAIGNKLHLKAIAGLSAETLAQDGLNAALVKGDVAASSFWASLLGPIALVVAGVAAVAAAIDFFTISEKEANQTLEENNKKLDEQRSKIEELNSAYEEQNKKLEELYKIPEDKRTEEQKEQIKNLEKQNELLEIQIELEKRKLEAQAREDAEDNEKALDAKKSKYFTNTEYEQNADGTKKVKTQNDNSLLDIKKGDGSYENPNAIGSASQLKDTINEQAAQLDKLLEKRNRMKELFGDNALTQDIDNEIALLNDNLTKNKDTWYDYQGDILELYQATEKELTNAQLIGDTERESELQADLKFYKSILDEKLDKTKEEIEKENQAKEEASIAFSWDAVGEGEKKSNREKFHEEIQKASNEYNNLGMASESVFNFKDTSVGKMIEELKLSKDDLMQIYGDESLVDKIFSIQDGTITNIQEIQRVLETASHISKIDLILSDDSVSLEELDQYGVTIDDLVDYTTTLSDQEDKVAKVQQMWDKALQNSLKDIGATNEELEGMQRVLVKDNAELEKINPKQLEKLAYQALKTQKALEKISSTVDDLSEKKSAGINISMDPESQGQLGEIRNGLAEAFDLKDEQIDLDWVSENLDLIKKGIENGGEDLKVVLKSIFEQDQFLIGLGFNENDLQDARNQFNDLIDTIPDNIEVGAEINSEAFIQQLQDMVNAGIITADNIQSALAGIGVEIDAEESAQLTRDLGYIDALMPTTTGSGTADSARNQDLQMQKQHIVAKLANLTYRARPLGYGGKKSVPKSSGGGGGSSNGSTPKNTDLSINKIDTKEQDEWKKDEIDRYHEVDTSIQMMDNSLERYGKISEKVFGTNLLSNYSKEISTLNDKVGELSKKWEIASDHQGEMVDKLNTKGFKFNEDGTIENYKQNLEDLGNKVEEKVKKYNKSIDEYNAKAKDFNTQAYKKEEQNEKLKFTEKEEKRYSELDAKIKKAKKEAEKKGTYDKLSKEQKEYIGLNDKEKKELKALEKKFAKQQKLQKDFDRWEYLREKKTNANLSKKEEKELKDYETKYKNLAGVAAKLAKEEEKLDKAKEKLDNMKQDYTDTIALADEYDQHVSEFMENILQEIDDALMQITEKKIASVQVVIDAVLDQRSLQQSWLEFTSAVSLSGLTSNIAKKSTQDLRAISDSVLNDTYKREATYGNYLLGEQKKQEKTLAAKTAMYNAADAQKEAIAQRQKDTAAREQAQKALEVTKKKENSTIQKANDANAKYKAAKETYQLDKTGKNKAAMEKARKERDTAEKDYKKSLENSEKAQNNLTKASNAVTEATYKENEAKKANTSATEEYQKLINTSDFGIDQKELRTQMQNALNNLQEQGKTLAENLQTQLGYLDEQINQTTENFNKLNEQIGYMIDSNKTIMDLATKYYGTLSEEGSKRREELAKANVDLAKAQLQGKIEYRDKTLPNERNILEGKITKAGEERDAAEYILRTLGLNPNEDLKTNTNNKEAYDKLTKEFQQQADQQKLFYDQANNKLDHYNDDMKKLAQEEIQVNKDIIDATNNAATAITESNNATLDTIFTKLTRFVNTGSNGYVDSDLAKAQWDWQKDRNSNYLDDINSAYEIQKLEYNVQKKIDKINNPAKQKEINNLLQKRIQLLREQDKLSEYELKRVEKEFNLELAKIALEESQNNKSTLRLRRDSQGNYSYQYTNDEDDIADKKQAVADAAIDLYNWDKNQDIKITDKIISLREQQVEDMKEAVNNVIEKYGIGSLSDENSEGYKILSARLTFIQDKYKELFGDLARESKEAKDNLTKTETAGIEGSGKLAESYLNGFVTFTTEGMRTWNDTQYDMVTTILENYDTTTTEAINSILATAQASATSFNDTVNLTGQSASGFFSEMNAEVKNIMNLLVGNGESTDGTLVGAFTQLTEDATRGLTTISKNIDTVTNAFKKWTTDTFPIIDQLKQKLSDLNDEILKAKEAAGITDNQPRTQNMTNPIEIKEGSTGKTYIVDAPTLSLATTNTGAISAADLLATTNTPTVLQKIDTVMYDKKTTKNKNTKTTSSSKKTATTKTTNTKKKKKTTKLDTGGYTGDWGSDEGRIGILHEKELVLNKQDTENILAAVQYMRDSILLNAMQSRMSGMSSGGAAAPTQNIQITANFPNASNHSEIETAFNNLLNRANQYMGRKF